MSDELLAVAQGIMVEPLAQRFALRSNASGDNRVFSPEDVLGERLLRVGGLLFIEEKFPGLIKINVADDKRSDALVGFAKLALTADPYLWSEEVRNQLGNVKVPRHVLSPRLLPQPRMWFTFETGIGLGHGFTLDCVLAVDNGDGFSLILSGEHREDGRPISKEAPGTAFLELNNYKYGAVYPDDFDIPEDPRMRGESGELRSFLAMLAFLSSPFIPKQRWTASRAARRDAARKGSTLAEQEVTFVMLRRPESRGGNGEGDGSGVEWKHRWVVSGHLRAQWYPSEQAHRLIWISPYMKGPDDAPLLEHVYKVAQ